MPRPRQNDPLGVSDNPAVVTDPARVEAITTEFQNKLAYVAQSFKFARTYMGDNTDFNESLEKLRRAVKRKRPGSTPEGRLYPEIEMLISHFAREEAVKRHGFPDAEVIQADIEAVARRAAKTLQFRRGRPVHAILRHHVEGLMALVQETTGKPVRVQRQKNSVYDPHFVGAGSVIRDIVRSIDSSTTETALVNIVVAARRKYAGKPMRFLDFFPGYGTTFERLISGDVFGPGWRIERFEANIPIYYP